MTTEIRPLSDLCQMHCDYCYQEPLRAAGNFKSKYNMDAMKTEILKVGTDFSLFGGEALLVPEDDLEELFRFGFENFGKNGIQTNGALINDNHLRMFKEYNVNVGVSVDGPNELNGLRKVRNAAPEATQKNTETIIENIRRLVLAEIPTSVIITLHRVNGSREKLPRLLKFIRWLGDIGVRHGNVHTLEVDSTMPDQDKNVLTPKENAEAMLTIAKFMSDNPDLGWSPFTDMENALLANGRTNCVWNFCDPLNTQAVYGIEGDGAISNCGRTNKEGIGWYKSNSNSYGRYISLYNTPQDKGGCKGCRFFVSCGGSCPGESISGDFRNKTIHCHTQKVLLSHFEKVLEDKGSIPISKSALLPIVEQMMISDMMRGVRPSLEGSVKRANDASIDVVVED